MNVKVRRGDVLYFVTSEEQRQLFLDAGYKVIEDKPKRKSAGVSTTKTTKTTGTKKKKKVV